MYRTANIIWLQLSPDLWTKHNMIAKPEEQIFVHMVINFQFLVLFLFGKLA